MNKIKGLTFAAMFALSLLVSATDAFAKESNHSRETAWTDIGEVTSPIGEYDGFTAEGVTWE